MDVVLGQILEEEVEVESHGHRQMGGLKMSGWRMGRSGKIGCVNGLMVVNVLEYGEVIDGCLDGGNHGDLD